MAMFSTTTLIPKIGDADTAREVERLYKLAATAALQTEEGGSAITPFKTNGTVTGHKVGDNIDAVRALAAVCGTEYPALRNVKISDYRKSQLLDAVIRPWQEVGKDGKLTGRPGPRTLALTHKQQNSAPAEA
jgi:hypothetical protein